jgi:hypothetical protein
MKEELGRLKDRLRGHTSEVAWVLSDLLGLELWLQVFFGEGRNDTKGPDHSDGRTTMTTLGGAR